MIPYYEARKAIQTLLEYIGEDCNREGLKETPDRILKSYEELFAGYKQTPDNILKTFVDGSESYDEIVLLKSISFYSTCEHHGLPFSGFAHIAYLPDKRIVGISKLARLLEVFSRRLQVQERLTTQITKAMDEHLQPQGSACVIEASHLCLSCRGVNKQNTRMVTSSLTGMFRTNPAIRQELFSLIN